MLSLGTTASYIVRNIEVNHIISFGSLKIKVHETTLNKEGKEVTVKKNQKINITSSAIQNRIIKIENIGVQPLYTRFKLLVEGKDKNKKVFDATKYVSFFSDNDDWIYENGWFYYKNILTPTKTTSNAVIKIIFDVNNITIDYPKSEYLFKVDIQCVQSKNNADTVLKAQGWPK